MQPLIGEMEKGDGTSNCEKWNEDLNVDGGVYVSGGFDGKK